MRDYQQRWDDPDAVRQFSEKSVAQFFRSETYFLEAIAPDIDSVLDIGCAAGRFIELLRHYGVTAPYTGIDVSLASIDLGRANYPGTRFIGGDALDCELAETFRLVNATGVLQHEPRFDRMIDRMLQWSSRYVLFDVKFAAIADHIADMAVAYCGRSHRLHYILLSPTKFLAALRRRPEISRISIYGYETPLNDRTVVPHGVGPIVSAGVLLEKGGRRPAELKTELPAFLKA